MVVGLCLGNTDQSDRTHILSVSLALSLDPFSSSHRQVLACGSGGPWIRPIDNGKGKGTSPSG